MQKLAHYLNLIKPFIASFEKEGPLKKKKKNWLLRQGKVGRKSPLAFFVTFSINEDYHHLFKRT